jgi:hypothetical protein
MSDWMFFCPGCGMEIGVTHERNCPEEECPYCHGKLAGCGCCAERGIAEVPECKRVPWPGFPGLQPAPRICRPDGDDEEFDERFAPDE